MKSNMSKSVVSPYPLGKGGVKSCQSIQELERQLQLVQKRGASQCVKFLSAFRHCILWGYLLSLNRKLFQIDRQTERCAECVNWNHHIHQFPSPGAGSEPGTAQVLRECQEYVFCHPPHHPSSLPVSSSFPKQLAQVFQKCFAGQSRGAGVPMAEAAERGGRNTSICVKIVVCKGFTP